MGSYWEILSKKSNSINPFRPWLRSLSSTGVRQGFRPWLLQYVLFLAFSQGSSRRFIFTHISVLGVRQISSSLPPVGRELLFKVLRGWSPSATVQALLPLLSVDLGWRGCVPWFNAFASPTFSAPSRWCFQMTQVSAGKLSRGSLWVGCWRGAATNKWIVSDLGNLDLCFSQIYFHFIINTSSFINLNWFPETDPGSRNSSQCGRQDCQQRWVCIFKDKVYLPGHGLQRSKFGGLKLLFCIQMKEVVQIYLPVTVMVLNTLWCSWCSWPRYYIHKGKAVAELFVGQIISLWSWLETTSSIPAGSLSGVFS